MALVKTLLFTLVVAGTTFVYLPYWMATATTVLPTADPGKLRYVSIVPFAIGGLMYFGCAWDFATKGRGTPAPIDAPKHLVVQGLYRYIRNPMYVGGLAIIAGHVLWSGALVLVLYGLALFSVFHLFVVLYEEPTLARRFGDSYTRYRKEVPRWLPRFPR